MRHAWPALLLFISALLAAGEAPPDPVREDPMAWTPPKERPVLKERVGAKEFPERRATALRALLAERKDEVLMPARGLRVQYVSSGSPAKELGLSAGDLIFQLDGQEIDDPVLFNQKRKDTPQTLKLWSSLSKSEKTLEIQPGKLGVQMSSYRMLMRWTFTQMPADPRWEENVRLAAFIAPRDPDLAETLLYHAQKAGCPSCLEFDEQVALVYYLGWRYPEAMDAGWFVLQQNPTDTRARANFILSAWLMNKYEAALNVPGASEAFPQLCAEMTRRSTEHLARPEAERRVERPLETAKRLFQDSMILRSEGFPRKADVQERDLGHVENILSNLFEYTQIRYNIGTDRYDSFAFGPGAKNVLFKINFATRLDPKPGNFLKHFTAGLMDFNGENAKNVAIYGVNREILGICCMDDEFNIGQFDPELTVVSSNEQLFTGVNAEKSHTFTVAVWEGRAEMQLDGRTIYYGPAGTASNRLGVVLKGSGIEFRIWHVEAYELLSEAEKNARLKAEINRAFRQKYTRIHFAAERWDNPSTTDLLAFNPDLTLRNSMGEQPLHCAVRGAIPGNAQALFEKGAKLDVYTAAALGKKDELKAMLAATPPPNLLASPVQWSVLHGAASSKDPEIVNLLVKAGADVNARTSKRFGSRTPLMWAARENANESVVKALIEAGADVNIGCANKNTALWYAERFNADAIVKLLTAKNAARSGSEAVRPPGPPPGDF